MVNMKKQKPVRFYKGKEKQEKRSLLKIDKPIYSASCVLFLRLFSRRGRGWGLWGDNRRRARDISRKKREEERNDNIFNLSNKTGVLSLWLLWLLLVLWLLLALLFLFLLVLWLFLLWVLGITRVEIKLNVEEIETASLVSVRKVKVRNAGGGNNTSDYFAGLRKRKKTYK